MLWPPAILIAAAVVLAIIGLRITSGPGAQDGKVGGAIFIILAIMAGVGGALWWIIAVTIKAFWP